VNVAAADAAPVKMRRRVTGLPMRIETVIRPPPRITVEVAGAV
jgi:hypothetical protein